MNQRNFYIISFSLSSQCNIKLFNEELDIKFFESTIRLNEITSVYQCPKVFDGRYFNFEIIYKISAMILSFINPYKVELYKNNVKDIKKI